MKSGADDSICTKSNKVFHIFIHQSEAERKVNTPLDKNASMKQIYDDNLT